MENEPKQIFAAIPAIMKAVGAIGKNQVNPHQKYNFRGIDDVYNAIQPALIENGVCIVPQVEAATHGRVVTSGGKPAFAVHVRVKHVFYATDGSFIEAVTVGEAMDNGNRATAKAMTDAYKTAVFKTFCIPVDASDPEQDSHELGNGKPNSNGAAPPANSNGALATHTTNDNADIPF